MIKDLLFVGGSNPALAPFAEGLARRLFGSLVRVRSASVRPGPLDPDAAQVLAESGIDVASLAPVPIDQIDGAGVDRVVGLGAEPAWPTWSGRSVSRLHWPIDEPSLPPSPSREAYRALRDRLLERLLTLAVQDLPAGITLAKATRADEDAIARLLADAHLPPPAFDAAEHVVARRAGRVVGVAAIERDGHAALLRSVAVADDERGTGLGVALSADRLLAARAGGATSVYLLTTTADRFFQRFGFRRCDRTHVPDAFARASGMCPSSAICMTA